MFDIQVGDFVRSSGARSFYHYKSFTKLLEDYYDPNGVIVSASDSSAIYQVCYVNKDAGWCLGVSNNTPVLLHNIHTLLLHRPKYKRNESVQYKGSKYKVISCVYKDANITYLISDTTSKTFSAKEKELTEVNSTETSVDPTNLANLVTWAVSAKSLKRGMTGPAIRGLQKALGYFDIDCGGVDGVFGSKVETGVEQYEHCRLIGNDSVVEQATKLDMVVAYAQEWKLGKTFKSHFIHNGNLDIYGGYHPKYGVLPNTSGKISHFGGPNDPWDRMYGQYLIWEDPSGSVAALYKQFPELVDLGLFRAGFTDPLPMTTDNNGNYVRAGISWCLNPGSYYLAMRWAKDQYPVTKTARIALTFKNRTVIVAPTDKGPARWTGIDIDLSPGAEDALGARSGENGDIIQAAWAEDDSPLGPVE